MKTYRKIIIIMLIVSLALSSFFVSDKTVHAYSMDYDYIDNLTAESGYAGVFDDDLCVIDTVFNLAANTEGKGNLCYYWVSSGEIINDKRVIVPMTKDEFSSLRYNLNWGEKVYLESGEIEITEEMTQDQIDALVSPLLEEEYEQSISVVLTESKTFYTFNTSAKYNAAYSETITGDNLCIASMNNADLTGMKITVTSMENISEYFAAYNTGMKSINISFSSNPDEIVFPLAFCYGCTSLKYVTYPQDISVEFGDYSFAKCTSLVHFTGLGEYGATKNFNNTISTPVIFGNYAFSGCTSITHIDITTDNVTLSDYAFGNSGLTYIGIFDYEYSKSNESKYLSSYTTMAASLVKSGNLSDKAFDNVSAERVYVAHKDIYDAMDNYCDGVLFSLTLAVANVVIQFDSTDTTGGEMEDVIIRYDDSLYTLTNCFSKHGYIFSYWTNDNGVTLVNNYNAAHNNTDWITAFYASDDEDAVISSNTYRDGTTLYPVWVENTETYTITYELNGGSITSGNIPTTHTYGKITYLTMSPIKDKCVFAGWYLDEALTERVYNISADTCTDITLYAAWDAAVASLGIPTKKGYRFLGYIDSEGNEIDGSERLSDYENNIYYSWLDVRWTIKKKGSNAYIKSLKTCYNWYSSYEKNGDSASFSDASADGSIIIYGAADGYVTKNKVSLNIFGDITSVTLKRNGKKVKISSSYFTSGNSDGIYLSGYTVKKNGKYVLTVKSKTATKKITFMIDNKSPTLTGVVKTSKKTKTFKITQTRRFYKKAIIKWSDAKAGVSSVYINGKKLSSKKVKIGKYTIKKAGTYQIVIYDYLGNKYKQKIIVDDENSDVKLPSVNLKNKKTYSIGKTLRASDKSGIKSITITNRYGVTKTYKRSYYTFKSTGKYKIKITDKAGNIRKLTIYIKKDKALY